MCWIDEAFGLFDVDFIIIKWVGVVVVVVVGCFFLPLYHVQQWMQ